MEPVPQLRIAAITALDQPSRQLQHLPKQNRPICRPCGCHRSCSSPPSRSPWCAMPTPWRCSNWRPMAG
jgi:hypothetical protein